MTEPRDSTRIVRSWLESGSTAIPDHVLDAALSEVHSTPQRRPWSPWRSPRMQPFLRFGAVAAVLVLAVILGRQLLPSFSGIGGPSPTPFGAFGGTVTFLMDGTPSSLDIDARADGLSLSGTAVIEGAQGTATLNLECARHEGNTWMFAGRYDAATPVAQAGENGAVLVVDGQPQQVGRLDNSEIDPLGPCEQFVMELQSIADLPAEVVVPVDSGRIALPPAP